MMRFQPVDLKNFGTAQLFDESRNPPLPGPKIPKLRQPNVRHLIIGNLSSGSSGFPLSSKS